MYLCSSSRFSFPAISQTSRSCSTLTSRKKCASSSCQRRENPCQRLQEGRGYRQEDRGCRNTEHGKHQEGRFLTSAKLFLSTDTVRLKRILRISEHKSTSLSGTGRFFSPDSWMQRSSTSMRYVKPWSSRRIFGLQRREQHRLRSSSGTCVPPPGDSKACDLKLCPQSECKLPDVCTQGRQQEQNPHVKELKQSLQEDHCCAMTKNKKAKCKRNTEFITKTFQQKRRSTLPSLRDKCPDLCTFSVSGQCLRHTRSICKKEKYSTSAAAQSLQRLTFERLQTADASLKLNVRIFFRSTNFSEE